MLLITKKNTMKTNLILTLAAASTLTLNACKDEGWPCIRAKGDVVRETRLVEDFDRIEMNLSGNVFLYQDPEITTPVVEVETNENIMERIETDVKSGILVIKDERCIKHLKTLNIYVTVPDLESVYLNGSGDIITQHQFTLDNVEMSINGSGNIRFNVEAEEVKADINGSGDIILNGTTTDLNIGVNGSGDIKAYDMSSVNCYIDINGSGSCEVNVSQRLHVEITGSGDVHYDGTPTEVIVNNQGSGSVSPR